MRIHLSDYQEGAVVDVEAVYDPKQLDLEFVDLHYTGDLKLKGQIQKEKDTLTFRGCMAGRIEQVCGRCLKRIVGKISKDFTLYYEIKGQEIIDTTDDLRETLILDHPVTFLCSETCRGLCPVCGADFNETTCRCKESPRPGSLTSLKEVWDKTKKGRKKHGTS